MRTPLAAVFAFVVAASLAACGTKQEPKADPGPPCPVVVDNMLVVMKQGLAGHDTVQLGNRDQMIAQCEGRKMTAKERTCLAGAKDITSLANCRTAKPGAPAAPASQPTPTPTRPLPQEPAPQAVGSGQ